MDAIGFIYINQDGEVTERVVIPEAANETHLQGFDLDKGEERTFRLERIENQQIIVIETKEILSVIDLCNQLPLLEKLPSKPLLKNCVHFTGFPEKRKAELAQMVIDNKPRFNVAKSITLGLTYLVYNANRAKPSEKKIAKAQEIGATIWTEEEFLQWVNK